MVAERFISGKLKFQGNVAATAVAVSFFVIIVAVAVSSGFRHEVREGVAALSGDIRIVPFTGADADPVPMSASLPQMDGILAIPGVKEVTPSVQRPGIVKCGEIVHGVVVKGIPGGPEIQGERPQLAVSIPHRLQEITGVREGESLTVYFIGEKVRVRKFNVAAVHRDIIETDDNLLVYADIADMQRLSGWEEDEVSCLNVRLGENYRSRRMEDEIAGRIGFMLRDESLYVSSSARDYPQIFDWLGLLDFNVAVILILMTIVAGFNMISGLLIMLLKNVSAIGTLKTMGMTDASIGKVFVRAGAVAVLKGLLIGNALALLFCLIQGTTHFLPLDPENYFVSFVPVHVNLWAILAADAVAYAAILLMLWLPARMVAKIDPAKTVKAD